MFFSQVIHNFSHSLWDLHDYICSLEFNVHYVVSSNDSIVWSGLDMWATGGGCVGQLTLVAVYRVSVSSHSLECLSRTFSNTVPVS